jgi:hypothetical protein
LIVAGIGRRRGRALALVIHRRRVLRSNRHRSNGSGNNGENGEKSAESFHKADQLKANESYPLDAGQRCSVK